MDFLCVQFQFTTKHFIQFNNTIFKYIILPFMRIIKELYTYLTYLLVYFKHMPFYFKIIGC